MKKLMHIMFLSCLKATELIEKKLHFKLSITEKLQLKVHKMMCDACTNFEKQSLFLEKGLSDQEKIDVVNFNLEEFKQTIVDKLNK